MAESKARHDTIRYTAFVLSAVALVSGLILNNGAILQVFLFVLFSALWRKMARDVVDDLLTGYPMVFYFIISVFCLHLAALVYWMYTMFSEPAPPQRRTPLPRKQYTYKDH